MPVAYNQLDEIMDVITEFVHPANRAGFITRLKNTKAYTQNKSYAITIDRISAKFGQEERNPQEKSV